MNPGLRTAADWWTGWVRFTAEGGQTSLSLLGGCVSPSSTSLTGSSLTAGTHRHTHTRQTHTLTRLTAAAEAPLAKVVLRSPSSRTSRKRREMPLHSTLSGRGYGSTKAENTQSNGKSFEQLRSECLQTGVLFEDPDFPAVDSSLYYSQSVPVQIEWKRPTVS